MDLEFSPLNSEVNRVCRTNNHRELLELGPFIYAILEISNSTELIKGIGDKILCSYASYDKQKDIIEEYYTNMDCSFFLLMGVSMQFEWIELWVKASNFE